MSNTETILSLLTTRGVSGEQAELAGHIERLFAEHPGYAKNGGEREALRKAIRDLLRPRTLNLRTLIDSPDEIINSFRTRTPHRLDLLEILPDPVNGGTACPVS